MNTRALRVIAGGSLAMAFAAAPLSVLHSQAKPGQQPTWGTTPGQRNPADTVRPTNPTPTQTPTNPTTTTTTAQGEDIRADAPFIREAASANLMEVRLGQMAQTKAQDAAVKQFGQRMVSDHTNLENQLASMTAANGLVLKQTLNSKHQQQVTRLNGLSGQGFDRAYMELMVQAHQEDVANFQNQARSAKSNAVRTLAINSLPVLQQHLSLAMQVRSRIGGDTTTIIAETVKTDTSTAVAGNRGNVRADAEFIRDVGAGNAMFLELSDRAEDKAQNRAVKQFAERVHNDYEKLQDQWSDVGSKNGMNIGKGMGRRHHEKVAKLEKTSDRNFDQTFMTIMVQQLHDRVTYWQKEGRATKSAEVRRLVNQGLPIQEQRYAEAQQIARQIGVNPEAALRNRTDISSKDKEKDKDK